MQARVKICQRKIKIEFEFELDGDDVLLFGFNSNERAVQNTCTHMKLPLSGGKIDENGHITCPFHGTSYCTKDGSVQKWCDGLPEDMPPENVQMMKSMKQVLLNNFNAIENEASISVAKN